MKHVLQNIKKKQEGSFCLFYCFSEGRNGNRGPQRGQRAAEEARVTEEKRAVEGDRVQ
jgi:hypothetical protein